MPNRPTADSRTELVILLKGSAYTRGKSTRSYFRLVIVDDLTLADSSLFSMS